MINLNFEKLITTFFKEVFSFPLSVDLVLLSDQVYSKEIDSTTMAELRSSTAEEKVKTLKGVAEKEKDKTYVRKIGLKVNLATVTQEFLKAYYPNEPEQKLNDATQVFADAFHCHVHLFDDLDLRRFFMKLCMESDTVFKWTGLPKQL